MDAMIKELEKTVINSYLKITPRNETNRYITDMTHHSSMILKHFNEQKSAAILYFPLS